mmetsp:Transcript_4415/g.4990  ORF Transcript_4415/g.4990 Transcript_4415/m.4990 type:complete len:100 (+) Transcript_4415:347-646(+)
MNLATSDCWIMTLDEMLSKRLPNAFKTEKLITWTQDIRIELACFLGNDYIGRVPGNGPAKASKCLDSISELEGDEIYQCIYDKVIVVSSCKEEDKLKWN